MAARVCGGKHTRVLEKGALDMTDEERRAQAMKFVDGAEAIKAFKALRDQALAGEDTASLLGGRYVEFAATISVVAMASRASDRAESKTPEEHAQATWKCADVILQVLHSLYMLGYRDGVASEAAKWATSAIRH